MDQGWTGTSGVPREEAGSSEGIEGYQEASTVGIFLPGTPDDRPNKGGVEIAPVSSMKYRRESGTNKGTFFHPIIDP